MRIDQRFIAKAVLSCASVFAIQNMDAQVQLKNNLLYDASLTPNANIEIGLSRHWTTDIGFGLNPWNFNGDKKIRHWLLQPELRRYFCQRMDGSFIAFHLMGGEFNAGNVDLPFGIAPCLHHNRYEGWYVGGGFGYGYQWPVSRHFSVEAEIAVGYDYLKYRKYPCAECGRKLDDGHYHYFGPTKIALNLIYNINNGVKKSSVAPQPGLLTQYTSYASQPEGAAADVLGGKASIYGATLTNAGQMMTLSMLVNMDSLHMRHGQSVALRPVLRSNEGEEVARFRPLLINSHDQHVMYLRGDQAVNYPDPLETGRRNGRKQTVSYTAQVPYEDWMDNYTLEIEEDLCGCGDLLADNTTPLMHLEPEPEPLNPLELIALTDVEPSPYKPVRNLHGTAYINFVVDRWEMKPDYMDNRREIRKITDTLNIMVADHNISVDRIKIHGWASPESPYEHNRMLAQNRAQSLTDYIQSFYRLPDNVFAKAGATPENWIGLLESLDTIPDAVLPHKAEFRSTARKVLSDVSRGVINQADRDELALKKKYPSEYEYIHKNVYPHLRRSDYEITFRVREFTLEEAKEIYMVHPDQLSLHEFWDVAHTFEYGSEDYNRCMDKAFTYYPDSTVAALNVANAALRRGDVKRASVLLEKSGESGEAVHARAVLAILEGRYDDAERLLREAEALGINVSRNREAVMKLREQK